MVNHVDGFPKLGESETTSKDFYTKQKKSRYADATHNGVIPHPNALIDDEHSQPTEDGVI